VFWDFFGRRDKSDIPGVGCSPTFESFG